MLYNGGTDMNRSSCWNTIDSMLGVNALKLPKLSLIRGSAMIIALLACLATPVLAADGDIAGPGHKGTIQQSGGSTFEYENADSGQGKFTMGQSDTSLTAEYDAIYYRVIFDGTPNIGNPTTTKSAEVNQSAYYLEQDITAFNALMAVQGDIPPASDSENNYYTLRYDNTYTLPSNDTFSKLGYTLVGWQTYMPSSEDEMEAMAQGQNGFEIVTSFDGTGADRQTAFIDNFYKVGHKETVEVLVEKKDENGEPLKDSEGNVIYEKVTEEVTVYETVPTENSANANNNVATTGNKIIADGGQIKNLTYGGYAENEIITKQYKTVTLYAIWKLKHLDSEVYYQLQKADGTYQYDTADQANVIAAGSSVQAYIDIQSTSDFKSDETYQWISGGQSWNDRTIKSDSRVYKYVGDTAHDAVYCPIQVQDSFLSDAQLKDPKIIEAGIYDTGNGYLLSQDNQKIFIQVPRKTVQLTVHGLIQTNGSGIYYTNPYLTTDDGDRLGTFSLKASNSSATIRQAGSSEDTDVELDNSTTLTGLYKLQLNSLYGNQVTISSLAATANNANYNYQYKGYTLGNGGYQLVQTTTGPANTGNSLTITLDDSNKYLLLYFDRSAKTPASLEIRWGKMTRQYSDPYSLGVSGQAYSGQKKTTGPWQLVTWKDFTVGTGQTTNKIYYMQLWLDNSSNQSQMQYDRLNINAQVTPSGNPQIELRRYYNNRDLIVVRFNDGITESQLQQWVRDYFQVITYNQQTSDSNIQSRLHMYVSSNKNVYQNGTGKPTGTVGSWQSRAGNLGNGTGFVPNDSQLSSAAYLIYDNSGLYWMYKYTSTGTQRTSYGSRLQAGDRIAHNYQHNKHEYDHNGKTLQRPQSISNMDGLQSQRAAQAGQSAETYSTQDNGIHVDVNGKATVGGGGMLFLNDRNWFGGSWNTINGYQSSVPFDLYAGDCSRAGTGNAWGEDHGGSMWDLWVNWEYTVLIQKIYRITLEGGTTTPCYTIPKQYPIVIKYNVSGGWGSGEDIWSNQSTDLVNGFNCNWVYGYYMSGTVTSNNKTQRSEGIPTNYTTNLSTKVLHRYGYVWDGRWYIIYNQQNSPKSFNWLTNQLTGSNTTYSSSNLLTSKLNYNQNFGQIQNAQTYSSYNFYNYGYDQNATTIEYKASSLSNSNRSKFEQGYIPFTNTEKSNGQAVSVDYRDLLQLWMQSGGQKATCSVNDAYTGGVQKSVECRVITLYAARTVPIQYTVKYVSGGQDAFAGVKVPYSWSTGNYNTAGKINNSASAIKDYQEIAESHALKSPASGTDTSLGAWYRQQFVYDTEGSLLKSEFSRPDGQVTIEGESLDGYSFIGWTTYKDTTGNNENASYRNGSTKYTDKGIKQTAITKDGTTSYGSTFTTGSASQAIQQKGNQVYDLGESNNPVFLTDGQAVKNLLNTIQKSEDGQPYTVSGKLTMPNVVYRDEFKWPEIVLYPNWRKQVTLTIKLDDTCTDTDSQGGLTGKTAQEVQSTIYGSDYIYNNQYYYPVSLDRVLYNSNSKGSTSFTSWRYGYDSTGKNSVWQKDVESTILDSKLSPIRTDYRFLGLQFSNKTTYPATAISTQEFVTGQVNGTNLRLPEGAPVQENQNKIAYSPIASLSHKRVYALQTYDSTKTDADNYSDVLEAYFLEPTEQSKANGHVGVDDSYGYYSTIDCYNDTTLYAVWEPIMQTQVQISKVGGSKVQSNRINSEQNSTITVENVKAGTGFTTITSLDGIVPTDKGDSKTAWKSPSYNAQITYEYNDNFKKEIVSLYENPIASDPNYKQVLDTLNSQATFTQNQVDGESGHQIKVKSPHIYKSWQFYLPVYLGTAEMEKASGGAFVYSPDKSYAFDVVTQRYSFYYSNFVPDSNKDPDYKNNETVVTTVEIYLGQGLKPPYVDPNPDPNPGGDGGSGIVGGGPEYDGAGSVLDDIRIHVQLH